ncbi:solute carrier family 23 member 1-like [Babylonia areolata]|uniref:solute carrier family 23 member 1-like n=1 Tax=Babylonia areolata TaxID=304850 RepID=UPI003FD58770
MDDHGNLVKFTPTGFSTLTAMGIANPAHVAGDGVELTKITRRHSDTLGGHYWRLPDHPHLHNHHHHHHNNNHPHQRHNNHHNNSPLAEEENPKTSEPTSASPGIITRGSEVFGLCCSASGRVPPPPSVVVGERGSGREGEGGGYCGGSGGGDVAYDVGGDGDVKGGDDDDDDDDDDDVEGNKKGHSKAERQLGIEYAVTDVPPVHLCFLFGLQQVLLSISSTISIPLIVSGAICAGDLTLVKSEIMSSFLFMCGICTILQVLVGVRLPIIQGGCHKFIPAITALMALDMWKCPADMGPLVEAYKNGSTEHLTEMWQSRMREIQGGIMLASLAQILIGCTGFLGILLQYLGPITIVPTISLVGLSLVDVALRFCEKHWGITALTVGLVFLFSLYLRNIRIPFPSCSRQKGCRFLRYPIFKLLPVILAVVLAWSFCAVLTATDTLEGSGVRTDSKNDVLQLARWFFFPYPGQWGLPTVSLASFMAMLAATITSVIESVGDYYACARISGVPPPPAHAVNRGIAMEGLGSLISGAVGSGGATTSYSQNVGSIGFTKVASRWAYFTAGLIFLVSGLCGKFGALLTLMPDPVLGGIVLVSFGMVTSVGLSTLSFVDLSSGRNLTIIGSSLMIGLMIPEFMKKHPDAIDTGSTEGDQVLRVLLGTAMFVGGVTAFFLDNTVPGTAEERGIIKWRQLTEQSATTTTTTTVDDVKVSGSGNNSSPKGDNNNDVAGYINRIYGFPYMANCLRRVRCCKYVPFMPSFAFRPVSPFKWLCRKFERKS